MKKINKETINIILVVLAFVFNIIIFAPLEIFYTNKKEFWFEANDILPIIIPLSIVLFIILTLITILLKDKKRDILIKIIFILTLGLYLQGNFFNIGYKVLDGSEVQWNTMIGKGLINTAIWLFILTIPYIFSVLKKEKLFKTFTLICSTFIILIQVITLSTVIIGTNKKNGIQFVNKDIFNLSENNNIVVFMSDTFEGTYMNEILQKYPEYKDKLKDFIYFDNCTGVSFYTYSSMPALLTGVECKVGNTLAQNIEYCFDKSILYKELKANNYNIDIYAEKSLTPDSNIYIDNLEKVKSKTSLNAKTKITNKMYKYTLYRYLPHFLKPKFIVNSDEFYEIKKEDGALPYSKSAYYLDDVSFNKELVSNGISKNNKQNVFKFYQTSGMHQPYNTTANIEYDYSMEYSEMSEEEKRINECLASINILCNYIDELKKNNIYENTTIIFLADHGYENRFYTTLLVKKPNDSHEFKVSSAPVSLAEDLIPTILNIATNSKKYGKDFFDYEETKNRTRQVYDYIYEAAFTFGNTYKIISKIAFQTEGLAKNQDSFYIVNEEYDNEDKQLSDEYKFGDTIKIDEINDLNTVNLVGFLLKKTDLLFPIGCNISKNAYLTINTSKTENDITAEFIIDNVKIEDQTINFKIDNELIYTCKILKDNTTNSIKFKIPKDIWNKNKEITIVMEFPDAEFIEYNKSMMTSIILKEFTFTN